MSHLCITPSSWQWLTTSTIFLKICAACSSSNTSGEMTCMYVHMKA